MSANDGPPVGDPAEPPTDLAMFPLGSVLLPGMPLALRVFEPRYLELMRHVLEGPGEFGVVLIERGSEVGGGDARFGVGTLARITGCVPSAAWLNVTAFGWQRFEVRRWLSDDPWPRAEVDWLPDLTWDDEWSELRADAERAVRRVAALASEFSEVTWPAHVGLAEDPVVACWQLAGICPAGPLDQLGLLRAASVPELLTRLIELAGELETGFTAGWE